MRKMLAIAWKDIRLEFSSRATLVFFLGLPIVFTFIIGLGLQGASSAPDPNTDQRYPVVVIDHDHSLLAEDFITAIDASPVIRPVVSDQAEAEALFAGGETLALLTIPAGFEQALLGGKSQEVDLWTSTGDNRVFAIEQAAAAASHTFGSAVQAAQASFQTAVSLRPFPDQASEQGYYRIQLQRALELLADPPAQVKMTYAPEVSAVRIATGFEQSSPGQVVTWTLITLLAASEVFVSERLDGTFRRMLVTPTRTATIILGKIVGRLSMGLVQMALLIGFGAFALGVSWGNSWSALVVLVLAFGLAAVALGVLLGTFARTRSQAGNLSVMFAMILSALGGAWWPLEVTPQIYQTMVKVLPTTWAMIGFTDVIVRGQGLIQVLPEVGVLLGFAVLFFSVGVWRLRLE